MSQAKEQLEQQIRELQSQIKTLKAQTKERKGTLVQFEKDNQVVSGYGELYYYGTLSNGTKFCKKATSCTVLENQES